MGWRGNGIKPKSIESFQLSACLSLNNPPFNLNQNAKISLLMARFEKVLGVNNKGLGALKFVVFCTSPQFNELTVTGRNLSYLMKTINVYTSMSKLFSMLLQDSTLLFSITKRHDN